MRSPVSKYCVFSGSDGMYCKRLAGFISLTSRFQEKNVSCSGRMDLVPGLEFSLESVSPSSRLRLVGGNVAIAFAECEEKWVE